MSRTILRGDGNDGSDRTDARYNYKALPSRWLDERSQAHRHLGVMNILFADGHNKSVKASFVTGAPHESSGTFALKWHG